MADKLDPKELVSFKELLMSETITLEALVDLLERRGIITKEELIEWIKRIKESLDKRKFHA